MCECDPKPDECLISEVYQISAILSRELMEDPFFSKSRGKWSLSICDEKGAIVTFSRLAGFAAEAAHSFIRKKAIEREMCFGVELRKNGRKRVFEWITLESTT